MISAVNLGVVVAAIFAIMFFMVVYSTTLWEKSPEGVNLMLFPVGFILLALSSIVRRTDILPHVGADALSIAAWALVGLLMIQRGRHVLKAQRHMREWKQAQEASKKRAENDKQTGE